MSGFQSFAIVPAAGRSRRMGKPKLLLPLWGRPLIEHVLESWLASRVSRTVVVVRTDDAELVQVCRQLPVELVLANRPPRDMKASVMLALDHIRQQHKLAASDAWLVAPADIPDLSVSVIDALLDRYSPRDPKVIVPVRGDRRGHPLLVPWKHADAVGYLQPHEGISALIERLPHRLIHCDEPRESDVDTPDDYKKLVEFTDCS